SSPMVFFFSSRRRHTRWPRDWSSDVCSSDLGHEVLVHELLERGEEPVEVHAQGRGGLVEAGNRGHLAVVECGGDEAGACGVHDGLLGLKTNPACAGALCFT